MTDGFHSYGFDMQADFLNFYYDRQLMLQMPNSIPDGHGKYDRSMFIMANLAYGGGGPGNNISYILTHEQRMEVQYIRAWQGSGGSAQANDSSQAAALYYWPTALTLVSPQRIDFLRTALTLADDGNLAFLDTATNTTLWSTAFSAVNCAPGGCTAKFQNDGNFVALDGAEQVYWATNTWGNNAGSMTVQAVRPYAIIYDDDCGVLWSTDNETAWYRDERAMRVSTLLA